MLVKSKLKNEKIVLGLLSYTDTKDTISNNEELKQLLDSYREDDNYEVYLYSEKDSDNYIGILVIEKMQSNQSDGQTIVLQRVGVVPSFRGEGVGYQMYKELCQKHPNTLIMGSLETTPYVAKWSRWLNEELDG